jgi:hypothetical protein
MIQLRELSDVALLELTQLILAAPRNLTARDRLELLAINDEFMRRDAARALQMCGYCYKPLNGGPHCSNCGGL